MNELMLVDRRGDRDESWHRIRAVVVDPDGARVRQWGSSVSEPVFWRSAAKPFQLWPLVAGGGVERFQLEPRHLALGAASHSADRAQRAVAAEWLSLIDVEEELLACGGHRSLSAAIAVEMIRDEVKPTPIWSNCSGKHAGMLALARLNGWSTSGYERVGHPVQQAIAESISRWCGVPLAELNWGVDGCTAAAVAAPLTSLALAWARLGTSDDPAMTAIREAMLAHPELVAGSDRLDTVLMQVWPGRIVVKVGAEGVYAAALPAERLGIALKVEDGDMRVAAIGLIGILHHLIDESIITGPRSFAGLESWDEPAILDTRGDRVGETILRFPEELPNGPEA